MRREQLDTIRYSHIMNDTPALGVFHLDNRKPSDSSLTTLTCVHYALFAKISMILCKYPYDIFSFLCNNNSLYNKVTTLNLLDCLFTVKRHHTTFITWIDYGFLHFIGFSQNTILHNLFTSYKSFLQWYG